MASCSAAIYRVLHLLYTPHPWRLLFLLDGSQRQGGNQGERSGGRGAVSAHVSASLPHLQSDAAPQQALHRRLLQEYWRLEQNSLWYKIRAQNADDYLPGYRAACIHAFTLDYCWVAVAVVWKVSLVWTPSQGWKVWLQSESDWSQMGQIRGFFRSDFSAFPNTKYFNPGIFQINI